jgi:hypothetical protein
VYGHWTALSPLQEGILELLGLCRAGVYQALHRFSRTALKMGEMDVIAMQTTFDVQKDYVIFMYLGLVEFKVENKFHNREITSW